jgi:AmmeMemoRadiSam system protein A
MHPVTELARKAVEEYVRSGKTLALPTVLSPEMEEKAGVFVCLKIDGELRGCIGTFMPCFGTVAEEVVHNAISAATQDPRFLPVSRDDLPSLHYSVDILSPPEKIRDIKDLDPKKYGVIVVRGGLKGLLLPNLEGVDTVQEQLRIARMKAGIGPADEVELYRFEVRRFDE